jgi:tRNA modification GTPase
VEAEGVRRAQRELANADHALIIVDANTATREEQAALIDEIPVATAYTLVRNKIDLSNEPAGVSDNDRDTVCISALTGAGIDELRRHLEIRLGYQPAAEGTIIARQRHLESLKKASAHFVAACEVLEETAAGELVAEELLQVQNALAEITGQFSSDDLLGRIFDSFCIGK